MASSKNYSPARRERMKKAVELRTLGNTYAEIGAALGISHVQAIRDVRDSLAEVTRESAEKLLQLELLRLDSKEQAVNEELVTVRNMIQSVLASDESEHETPVKNLVPLWTQVARLLEAGLKVAAQRQRLLGLDRGITVDTTVDVTDAINDFLRPFTKEEEAAMMEAE